MHGDDFFRLTSEAPTCYRRPKYSKTEGFGGVIVERLRISVFTSGFP